MYNNVLFDLDGTLTESAPGIINSVRYTLRRYGLNDPGDGVLKKFIGPPLIDSFVNFCGFSPEKAAEAVDVYREYFADRGLFENAVYPGIPLCLKTLKQSGKRLAVATSKPQVFCERILRHFDLYGYFDAVAGIPLDGEDMTKAEVVKTALELLDADKSLSVMVGDRGYDVSGAEENRKPCVGVLYGYGSPGELSGAVKLCRTVEELTEFLMK